MPIIKLKSGDGETFEVDWKIARNFQTIKNMIEDFGMEEGEKRVIPLPIKAAILRKVITWATHHKDDPPPPEHESKEKLTEDISSWDSDFFKVDHLTLFDLLSAAFYLEIEGLLKVSYKIVANMMNGKSPEEIRKMFNIKNDLTPAEQEQIRRENEWLEKTKLNPN